MSTRNQDILTDYNRDVLLRDGEKRRVGRRGNLLCEPCRKAKRGYKVEARSNCTDPSVSLGTMIPQAPVFPASRGIFLKADAARERFRRGKILLAGVIPEVPTQYSRLVELWTTLSLVMGMLLDRRLMSIAGPLHLLTTTHRSTTGDSHLPMPLGQGWLNNFTEVGDHRSLPQTDAWGDYTGNAESFFQSGGTTFEADGASLEGLGIVTVSTHKQPSRETIFEILSDGGIEGVELEWITEYVIKYFQLTPNRRVTGFRAVFTLLTGEIRGWPVIEWREGYDTEVLAIFKIEVQTARGCCLMHYGDGIGWHDRKRWRRSVLTWQIGEVDDLKELLVVAQHMLGMLHWSDTDILNLYFQDSPTDCSDEESDLNFSLR